MLRSLLACALLALALALPASAEARSDQLHGAQLHSLWSGTSVADFDRELDLVAGAGGDTVRLDLSWSSLETEGKGRFSDWYVRKADTFLEHARARGLKVIGTLWSTPCWASTAPEELAQGCSGAWWDRGVYRYAPRDPADYADAAAWVARRWGSQLAALEIWNEPNLPDKYSLQAPDPARAYADILKTAYPRVKQESANLPVLGGALAFSDGEFLERLYDLGIAGHFDGISIHPYNEWRDPDDTWQPQWRKYTFLTGVPWVHEIMRAHGDGDKGLWLTEFGFSTCGEGSSWCVSAADQAEYVEDSFRIARRWDYVKAAIVYNLRNKGGDPVDREDQFGLVHPDFTPKPGYTGFRNAMAAYGTDEPVPAPEGPAPEAPAVVSPESVRVTTRGVAPVRISCSGAAGSACSGTLALSTRIRVRRHGRPVRRRGKIVKRRAVLGKRRFRTAAGESAVVRVRVRWRKHRRLRRRGKSRVRVRVTAIPHASDARSTGTFVVRYPKLRSARRKR